MWTNTSLPPAEVQCQGDLHTVLVAHGGRLRCKISPRRAGYAPRAGFRQTNVMEYSRAACASAPQLSSRQRNIFIGNRRF
jgi:hypothetical protein